MFWKLALCPFSGKEAPDMVDPSDCATLSHCAPQKQYFVKIRT